MINKDFCELIEYQLTKAFANSGNEEIKGFWCDGVLLPAFENEYSKETVSKTKQITMIAFAGPTGQGKYELILNFGHIALHRYAKGLDIHECLKNDSSFSIDTAKRKIFLQLD